MSSLSDSATYERARRLANVAIWTVVLQRRRLRSEEPEDEEFVFRKWADFQFLIVALTRLRRAAALAAKVPVIASPIRVALNEFDEMLPMLKNMRDVAEYIDDYALDKGKLTSIGRGGLEVGTISDTAFEWLDYELDVDVALGASEKLFESIRQCGATMVGQVSFDPNF